MVTDLDECSLTPAVCEQICVNSAGSYSCLCEEGFVADQVLGPQYCLGKIYILFASYTWILEAYEWNILYFVFHATDLDECDQNNGDCEQICTNYVGSYACSCQEGWFIDTNGKSCNGGYLSQIQDRRVFFSFLFF